MSADSYDDILKRAQDELTTDQQSRLAEELLMRVALRNGGRRYNITDLKGLDNEIWDGIDPDDYAARERDLWDG